MTKKWVRFEYDGQQGFGLIETDRIHCYKGDMFEDPQPNGEILALDDVKLLSPCEPSKIVAMWNNFHELAAAQDLELPEFPFYFLAIHIPETNHAINCFCNDSI